MIEAIQLDDDFMIDTQSGSGILWFLELISHDREEWILKLEI